MSRHVKTSAKPKAELPPLSPAVSALDHDAFTRAIEMMRAKDKLHADQINYKLEHEGFAAAGKFAAYSCQCDGLGVRPWEAPPMDAHDDLAAADPSIYGYRPKEIGLLVRLLAAGLSRFEPDPLAALQKVKR
jgi:hypothetical protein